MIAYAIQNYLEKNGITLKYLSEKTGINCSCIGPALKGKRKFSIDEYVKICAVLELPYDYFFIKSENSAVHKV